MEKISKKNISLIVYDFDGVMTDNRIILREDGIESVIVNRSDGLAVGIIMKMGIPQIIISTETNRVVESRAKKLSIDVVQGVSNKKKILLDYCNIKNIPLAEVVYLGNDINDFEAMQMVGCSVCPADAYKEIRSISKIVLSNTGGNGVIREFLDHIKE